MIFFFVKLYADFLAWLGADLYYVLRGKKGFRFIPLKRIKLYSKHLKGKTNKHRIKISQLEACHIYKTKNLSL